MEWGVEWGQEHQRREGEAELLPVWALVSESMGQEPEEAWRPQVSGGPLCLPASGQTAQTPGLADQPQSVTLTVILFRPFPMSPLQPPEALFSLLQLGGCAFLLRLSPLKARPALPQPVRSLPVEAWSPTKHRQLWEE